MFTKFGEYTVTSHQIFFQIPEPYTAYFACNLASRSTDENE
jgi:hypothetical protein